MKAAKSLVALGVVLALGTSQSLSAAQQKEEDSAYQWGRWSVLSPAAGGAEPYVAVNTPGADFNARPGDSDDFQPEIESVEEGPTVPEVVESCDAGAACGFATYSRESADSEGKVGPVLARFDLTETPPEAPADVTEFSVTDSGDAAFPDVDSVDTNGHFSDGGDVTGTRGTGTFDPETGTAVTDSITSDLSHSNQDTGQVYDFDGVNAGYWRQQAQQRIDYIFGDRAGDSEINTISDSDGYFVQGLVATVEQMEAFAAGRVSATYNGFVLDYASPAQLNFNFDNKTFNGNFGTANGFNGFAIDGNVNGVNFSAADSGREVAGSFFNGGLNASGAVNNGTQQGVFSADLTDSK